MEGTKIYEAATASDVAEATAVRNDTTFSFSESDSGIEITEMYAEYKPYGLEYVRGGTNGADALYFGGTRVRSFLDVISSNGEAFDSGKFQGSMRNFNDPMGEGEVDLYTVRDAEGNLTGIEAYSQEEFDARTEDRANGIDVAVEEAAVATLETQTP